MTWMLMVTNIPRDFRGWKLGPTDRVYVSEELQPCRLQGKRFADRATAETWRRGHQARLDQVVGFPAEVKIIEQTGRRKPR